VVKKDENFKPGDLIVYIEIDSILPPRPEFEFLRERKFRVRTIKLRKQISQGLVLPLSILPQNKIWHENDDVTGLLGIKKYDPESESERKLPGANTLSHRKTNALIKFLSRFSWFRKHFKKAVRNTFPPWIVKTDEERIQNKIEMFEIEKNLGTPFIVTEKIDGQSATYFLEKRKRFIFEPKYIFGVCSRNVYLPKPLKIPVVQTSYQAIAEEHQIETVLKNIIGDSRRIVLQGEIIGPGIQGNKYGLKTFAFYAFNLIRDGVQAGQNAMEEALWPHEIKTVTVLNSCFTLKDTIPKMTEYAKGKSLHADIQHEGIVLRNYHRNISFKVINPDFLLKYDA
jgi:hypothetical protein